MSLAQSKVSLSPSLLHFDYTEFSTEGDVLDNESGWITGVEGKLTQTLAPDWSIDVYASYFDGMVDYEGKTQAGVLHTTDTEMELFRAGVRIETTFYKDSRVFIDAQSHRWKRDIKDNNNVSGLYESYRWLEYFIGVNSDFMLTQYDLVNIEAGFIIIGSGELDVNLSRVELGSANLDLGRGDGFRINLSWQRKMNDNYFYGVGIYFEHWEFGRSNTIPTKGGANSVFVTEPESETNNIGIKFTIEYAL